MTERTFITAAEVAPLIGMESAQAFLSARQRLEEEESFPLPMPTCRRPLRWRRDVIEAWVNQVGVPLEARPDQMPNHQALPSNVVLLNMAREG